ncbi:nuclear transport factor 2 family protein [Aquimarina rhabdastrellae]
MKLLKLITLVSLLIGIISCSNDDNTATASEKRINKQIVLEAIEKVFDGQNLTLVDTYYADGYIQHNPFIADGKAGLIAAIQNMIDNGIRIQREMPRVLAQGDRVFTHSKLHFIQNGNIINSVIVGDIFRIENQKIKEHWDVIQQEPDPIVSIANNNTMIDGEGNTDAQISSSDLNRNINTATTIINSVLGNGQLDLVSTLFQEPYIQHNPNIPNGTAALINFLTNNGPLDLDIKQVIAEGDLVVTFNHIISFNNANIDMFRLNEDGKAVEHWDIIQSIPDEADFAHDNGFF